MIRFIGLFAFIVSQFLAIALPALERQDSLGHLFAMDRRDMITAPEHLGIINGKLTIGTPGGLAAGIDGLWAPPFVSSDFALRLEIFDKEIPTPIGKWWPFKLEQRGVVNGVAVSAAIVLVPGRRGGLVALTLHNPTSNALEAPLAFKTRGTLDYRGQWEFAQAKSSTATMPTAENSTLTLTAGERSIVLQGAGDALTWDAVNRVGTQTVALPPGRTATVYLAFALGPSAEAAADCQAIAAAPAKAIVAAAAAHD